MGPTGRSTEPVQGLGDGPVSASGRRSSHRSVTRRRADRRSLAMPALPAIELLDLPQPAYSPRGGFTTGCADAAKWVRESGYVAAISGLRALSMTSTWSSWLPNQATPTKPPWWTQVLSGRVSQRKLLRTRACASLKRQTYSVATSTYGASAPATTIPSWCAAERSRRLALPAPLLGRPRGSPVEFLEQDILIILYVPPLPHG